MSRVDGMDTWDDVEDFLKILHPAQPNGSFRGETMMVGSIAAMAILKMFRWSSRTPDFYTYSA